MLDAFRDLVNKEQAALKASIKSLNGRVVQIEDKLNGIEKVIKTLALPLLVSNSQSKKLNKEIGESKKRENLLEEENTDLTNESFT